MPRPATGSITETATGWRLRFRAYGNRESVTLMKADVRTRQLAEDELANIVADVRRGIWRPSRSSSIQGVVPEKEPTFQEFAESWYRAKAPTLKKSTQADYEWRLNSHLGPWFGGHPVSGITVGSVDRYRDEKVAAWKANQREREQHRPGTPKPKTVAGPESINKTLTVLGAILDLADEQDLIDRNPLRVNPRNRKVRIGRGDKPLRTYLDSAEQVSALLDAAGALDAHPRAASSGVKRAALAILVFGGLRIGELVTLRWRDVNLADGLLTVSGTKTGAAQRVVPMLPVLRDELTAWKARTTRGIATDPVISTATGTAWSDDNIRNRIMNPAKRLASEALEDAGRPPLPAHLTPHSLRRTAVSLWEVVGWSMTDSKAALGHESAKLTLEVYSRPMRSGDRERTALRALAEGAEWSAMGVMVSDLDTEPGLHEAA